MAVITVSDRPEDIDFEFVYRFLSEESVWAEGIGRDTQQRAIENSLCISAFVDTQQVGFARVVTDYATFAWVDDVFVDPDFRGQRVAHELMLAIMQHESLGSVASWWLSSSNPDARALFEKHGFARPDTDRLAKLMARPKTKPGFYRQ